MKLKLLEPLRELFKDEVRKLGVAARPAAEMVYRHPFPGPGLGVRILGEIRKPNRRPAAPRRRDLHRGAAARTSCTTRSSQAFAVFLPVRSVGVMGDGRRYDYVVALRAVETIDFMTARWAQLPYDFLDRVTHRIMNEVPGSRASCTTSRASRRRPSSGSEKGLSASITIYRLHAQVVEETDLLLRYNFDLSPPSETF